MSQSCFFKGKCQVSYWSCFTWVSIWVGRRWGSLIITLIFSDWPGDLLVILIKKKRFCCCWGSFLKSLLNLLQYCFYFTFWFFGHKPCGILGPQPRIEPVPPALAGEILTTESAEKSLLIVLAITTFHRYSYLHNTDEEAKVQRDGAISSRSHSWSGIQSS